MSTTTPFFTLIRRSFTYFSSGNSGKRQLPMV